MGMDEVFAAISQQVADARRLLADVLDEVTAMAGQPEPVESDFAMCDDRLRAVLVGLERVRNGLEATQADAMVAIGDATAAWDPDAEEWVGDEIGALLACSKVAGSIRYGIARQAHDVPILAVAWRAGTIDACKVRLIADQLRHLDTAKARELASAAVGYAAQHTPAQTRAWLSRRVIAADPQVAESRRESAMAERCVVITPVEDGMADLYASLPSVQARQIQQVLTTMAHQLGHDDARDMDQRRADVFVDLLVGRATPPTVELLVLAPADTVTGSGQQPAWLAGVGPITAQQTRGLLVDPATGALPEVGAQAGRALSDAPESSYRPSAGLQRAVRARDVTCRFPGCRRFAFGTHSGTDLDHTVPWPSGATEAGNLAVLCRRHHRLKHSGLWHVDLHPDGTMTWRSPSGRTYDTEPWPYADPPPELEEPDLEAPMPIRHADHDAVRVTFRRPGGASGSAPLARANASANN